MPYFGTSFKKHDGALTDKQARKGGKIATAMEKAGVPEGEAIATGIDRARGYRGRGKQGSSGAKARTGKTKTWTGK